MRSFLPDYLQPVRLRDKQAYAFTIGTLNEKPVQDFVDQVRQREGIVPPENAEELAYNLDHHPPERFEAEALEFTKAYFEEPSAADLGGLDLAGHDLSQILQEKPILVTPPGYLEQFMAAVVPLAEIRAEFAKLLARHIVVGYLEVPDAVSSIRLGGVFTDDSNGFPVVYAVAGPGCDLDDLIAKLRAKCREAFVHGGRERGPDKAVKTAWQRAIAHYLRRQGEAEGRIDLKVAELSFAIWPETRPQCDEVSPQYEAALRAEADRFRTNSANFKDWTDTFPGDEDWRQR